VERKGKRRESRVGQLGYVGEKEVGWLEAFGPKQFRKSFYFQYFF
jgi:hypothetical protein